MPSLLSPVGSSSNSRSYTPLADETNQYGDNAAPVASVTRNGTIVYAKRVPSDSSQSGSSTPHRIPSDEALANGGALHMMPHEKANGDALGMEDEDDLGVMRRTTYKSKGKGKERAWDAEMGEDYRMEKIDSYPPINEVEEEERRVQDNLARFAARDAARRRAARLSRQLPSTPPSSNGSSTSVNSRPFSWVSDPRRQSIFGGIMETVMGPSKQNAEGVLPLSSPQRGYNNPYEEALSPPPSMSKDLEPRLERSPRGETSPLAKHPDESGQPQSIPQINHPRASTPSSSNSGATSVPQSPTDGQGFTYGYAGPSWRGGNAAVQVQQPDRAGGEKWWHALCGWGNDDVDDQDDQAGRTNPFE